MPPCVSAQCRCWCVVSVCTRVRIARAGWDAEKELDSASFMSRGDPTLLYADLRKLGEGASGQVFLGTDRSSGEKVALKVAPASDLANLKQEIALQKMSTHPCIVSYKQTFLYKDQLWVCAACACACTHAKRQWPCWLPSPCSLWCCDFADCDGVYSRRPTHRGVGTHHRIPGAVHRVRVTPLLSACVYLEMLALQPLLARARDCILRT